MKKKTDDLTKVKAILTKRWETINKKIAKVKVLDNEKMLLNIHARKVLGAYLDRFNELCHAPAIPKTYMELARTLDAMDYFVKTLLKLGKKKRPLA